MSTRHAVTMPRLTGPFARSVFDPGRPLVFLHIPKAAGTSAIVALRAALAPRMIAGGFDGALFGNFADDASIEPALRAHIHRDPASFTAEADLVAAHMSHSTLAARYPHGQFVTVLREPVSRLLSHWSYWRALPEAHLHGWGRWAERLLRARESLGGFLADPDLACQSDNLATRMLLWPHPLIPDGDFIDKRHDAALIAQARARLDAYDFVGLVEEPGLAARLGLWLGRDFALGRENATPAVHGMVPRPLDAQLDDAVAERLDQSARLDLALWRHTARRVLPDAAPSVLRQRTLMRSVARHARLAVGA